VLSLEIPTFYFSRIIQVVLSPEIRIVLAEKIKYIFLAFESDVVTPYILEQRE
jgi:hypothetical protein